MFFGIQNLDFTIYYKLNLIHLRNYYLLLINNVNLKIFVLIKYKIEHVHLGDGQICQNTKQQYIDVVLQVIVLLPGFNIKKFYCLDNNIFS